LPLVVQGLQIGGTGWVVSMASISTQSEAKINDKRKKMERLSFAPPGDLASFRSAN
jgi:hypothetical protein